MQLRIVRNECKQWMTTVTTDISRWQQIKWYFKTLKWGKELHAYLLLDGNTALGYGVLRFDFQKKQSWMTAGLRERARGNGLGRMLIACMSELGYQDGCTPWIEVLDTTRAALVPDIKSGYRLEEIKTTDRGLLYIMKHKHDRELDGFFPLPNPAFNLNPKAGFPESEGPLWRSKPSSALVNPDWWHIDSGDEAPKTWKSA